MQYTEIITYLFSGFLNLVLNDKNVSDKNDYSSAQHLKRHVQMTANMNWKH